jgi:hypothetical protein
MVRTNVSAICIPTPNLFKQLDLRVALPGDFLHPDLVFLLSSNDSISVSSGSGTSQCSSVSRTGPSPPCLPWPVVSLACPLPVDSHFDGARRPELHDGPTFSTCMLDFWITPFSSRPARPRVGVDGTSRFSRVKFSNMPGVFDRAEPDECSWYCLPHVGTASAL